MSLIVAKEEDKLLMGLFGSMRIVKTLNETIVYDVYDNGQRVRRNHCEVTDVEFSDRVKRAKEFVEQGDIESARNQFRYITI